MQHTLSKYLLFQAVEEHTLLISSRVGKIIQQLHRQNVQDLPALRSRLNRLCLPDYVRSFCVTLWHEISSNS